MLTRKLVALFQVGFVAILLAAFTGTSFAQTVDLNASSSVRATNALAHAAANDVDVGDLTANDLSGFIEGMEAASFTDVAVDDLLMSAGTKRYKCSKAVWVLGSGIVINWWADARVSSGRVREVLSTGYNYSWISWIISLDAVVTASVTAYIEDSGRKIKIYIEGTVKFWFAGIPISTKALNQSCTKNA